MRAIIPISAQEAESRAAIYDTMTEAAIASLSNTELVALAATSYFAPTAANYPAVKHFFKCDEAAGQTTLVDVITGGGLTCSAVVKNNAYSVDPGIVVNGAFSGTIAPMAAVNSGALFVVADYRAAAVISLGNSAGARYSAGSSSSNLVSDGTNQAAGGAQTGGYTTGVIGFAVVKDKTGTIGTADYVHSIATDGTTTSTTAGATSAAVGAITPANVAGIAGAFTTVYGILQMVNATTLPANIDAYMLWMHNQWVLGNKVIHPALKKVS